jgi:PTH2 family peptidyl-tRNA hydrolase
MSSSSDSKESSIKMYILVNTSLDMKKGKIAGQVGHAVSRLIRRLEKNPNKEYKLWLQTGETKIVKKATEKEMEALAEKYAKISEIITDMGKTQIKEGSFTVLGFIPLKECDVPEEIINLKLL